MKAFLLTAATIMACAGVVFAQNLPPDYFWEVGFNIGYSNFTRPLGTDQLYQGNRTRHSTDYSVRLNYYATPHWMLNVDFGDRHWQSSTDWQLSDQLGQQLRPRSVTFVVADHAVNENVGISYVMPFYTRYNTYNKANLSFGVTFGMMQTANDGHIGYSKYNAAPDSGYTYMSRYDYGSGSGYNVGIQIGYTWYIIPRLCVNIDLGVRYAHIKTIDEHYASENSKFYLLYFPETVGLRWRF